MSSRTMARATLQVCCSIPSVMLLLWRTSSCPIDIQLDTPGHALNVSSKCLEHHMLLH